MLMPSKNWVQQQLAIARVSVLLSSRLWSHDDEECRRRMATVLQAIRPLLSSPAPHQRAATSTRSIRVHTNTARTRSDGARSPCSLQACGMPFPHLTLHASVRAASSTDDVVRPGARGSFFDVPPTLPPSRHSISTPHPAHFARLCISRFSPIRTPPSRHPRPRCPSLALVCSRFVLPLHTLRPPPREQAASCSSRCD